MTTVLLVDDDAFIRSTFARMFRTAPYELLVAASADEALELLASRTIDVIVTDQQMPGMCGADLLAHAKVRSPATIGIILTGEPGARSLKPGEGVAYRILYKPISSSELKSTIAEAIRACRTGP